MRRGGDADSLAEESQADGSNRLASNNGYDFLIDDEYQTLKAAQQQA